MTSKSTQRISSVYNHHHHDGITFIEPSLTQQQFKVESDINEILRVYRITGNLPRNTMPFSYGDFSDDWTYQEALDFIANADDTFAALPAQLRARFGNDPAQMLEFIDNPSNRDEAIKLGIIAQPQPQPQPSGQPTAQKPV